NAAAIFFVVGLAASAGAGDLAAQRAFVWHRGRTEAPRPPAPTVVYEQVPNPCLADPGPLDPCGGDGNPYPPEPEFDELFPDEVFQVLETDPAGFEQSFSITGPDFLVRSADDPAPYAFGPVPSAVANPFRGRFTPLGGERPFEETLDFAGDPIGGGVANPQGDPFVDPFPEALLPWVGLRTPSSVFFPDGAPFIPDGTDLRPFFGGDFSAVVPCLQPSWRSSVDTSRLFDGSVRRTGCQSVFPADAQPGQAFLPLDFPIDELPRPPGTNVAIIGGRGEHPLRPAPDLSHLQSAAQNPDGLLAQGLHFPPPPGASHFERNVDPLTGRPRVAGASGGCGDAGVPLFGLNPKSYQSMTVAGIGREPDCLAPGGGEALPGPDRVLGTDDDLGGGNANERDGPGTSPANALRFHHADQGLFATLCAATIGLLAAVDSRACAWNLLGSPEAVAAAPISPNSPRLVEVFAYAFAGDPDGGAQNFVRTLLRNTKRGFDTGNAAVVNIPIAPLNRDVNDGIITATNSEFNKPNFGNDFLPGLDDILTLDSTLTSPQRGIIGCGPLYGTRCDTSLPFSEVVVGFPLTYPEGGGLDPLNTEGNALSESWPAVAGTATPGLNGFSEESFTGTDGTVFPMTWVTTLRGLVQPGTLVWDPERGESVSFEGAPICTRELASGETVVLPGCRGLARIVNITDSPDLLEGMREENSSGEIQAVFDPGYRPSVDGCVLGGANFGGRSVVAVEVAPDGTVSLTGDTELARQVSACDAGSETKVVVVVGGIPELPYLQGSRTVSSTFFEGANLYANVQWADGDGDGVPDRFGGAGTLWHPLAGCLPVEEALDPRSGVVGRQARRCVFFTRDFAAEFLQGGAAIFRNELAALSWNFQMTQLITSCDSRLEGADAIENDPDCMNPERPWRFDKCSYAAPHLCRNVQMYLALTVPPAPIEVEIDVVPNKAFNSINVGSSGLVSVAILGSDTVDVEQIDHAGLAFGAAGAPPVHGSRGHLKDVNKDGLTDLVSHHRIPETGIAAGDARACLSGELDGAAFEACDAVRAR
ncbi:MAG: hypothetical protein V3U03_01995, partial [Myxococcota bacterium]